MDFFNDIGKKFSSMARSVTEKTREGVETTRLYNDLRSARNELEQLYCEYGRACFEIRMGGTDQAEADILAERIEDALERIHELAAQRDDMRSTRRCPACGSNQGREARFCSNCGNRIPEEAPHPEALPESAEDVYCPGCGAMMEAGTRFCPVCRKDLEAKDEPEEAEVQEKRIIAPAKDSEEPDAEAIME